MTDTPTNPIEDAFKKFIETNAFSELITLADQLRLAYRANDAVDIMRHWLKTTDIYAAPDDICCIAQRFAFLGAPEDAIALFDKLISKERDTYQPWLMEKAWAHCTAGDFATGRALWQEAMSQPMIHHFLRLCAPAEWSNIPKERYLDHTVDVRGKSVRILWDAGMGDAIQNLRYIHRLRQEGATRVYMDALPPFEYLMQTSGFGDVPNTFLHPLENTDCDYFAPHQTLLLRYEDGSPSQTTFPYIAPGQPGTRIQPVLDFIHQTSGNRRKVAIFWRSTNTGHRCEPYRSMHITDFLPLFALPGINFYSCIHGNVTEEEAFYLDRHGISHFGHDMDNMHDLACVFKEMDLVISVDSAPVHLASAMGIPVYAMISTLSEWRWGRGTTGSFLYPSLRLFRQKTLGKWQGSVNEIAALLAQQA